MLIAAMEQIASDLAQMEEMLRKEDTVIAGGLCKLIGRIFWGLEKPLVGNCPSLSSFAATGEKYQKCICRIIEYDRVIKERRVIKSGISGEEAMCIFTEMNRKNPEQSDLVFSWEMEYCASPHDDAAGEPHPSAPEWKYRCRIESKERAALIVKKLEKVSSDLGRQACLLIENKENKDNKGRLVIVNQTLADIMDDVYYPIFRVYPSLRPAWMRKEEN